MMKKGFTLIELLVVVLIIGILAAVALPQYQRAVAKAKFTDVMMRTDALVRAQEAFYLANSEFSNDYTTLDINVVPQNTGITLGGPQTNNFFCYNGGCWFINRTFSGNRKGVYFWGSSPEAQMFPDLFVMFHNPDNDLAGKRICCYSSGSSQNAKLGKFLCESFGGETAPYPYGSSGHNCKYF